jgi:homopolymeric O-antigen transport system permease protein
MVMESDPTSQLAPFDAGVTPEEAHEWAKQASRAGDWSTCARRWHSIRTLFPDDPTPLFQGIRAHLEANELEQAGSLLVIARDRYPNHPGSSIDSAKHAILHNDLDRAAGYIEDAQRLHPQHPETWINSALLASKQHDYERASECQLKAIGLAPDHSGFLIGYAALAMDAERFEEASERWTLVRDRFPKLSIGYEQGAQAARNLGHDELARDLLLSNQFGHDILSEDAESDPELQRVKLSPLKALLGLVWVKAVMGLRSEVRRNYLSFGWWVLEPLMYMAVYQIVFDVLLDRGGEGYAMLLITGLVPWMWTMKAVSASSSSITGGQNLMLQVGVQPIVFPLERILQATLKQIPVFLLLIGFVWFNGSEPGMYWLAVLPIILVHALLNTAVSLAIAAVIPFLRDLTNLVPTGLTLLMFLSGVFYDYQSIGERWHGLFLSNPFAYLIKCYRDVFIHQTTPDFIGLGWRGLVSLACCGLLVLMYRKLRYVYPRVVSE